MHDFFHLPTQFGNSEVSVFTAPAWSSGGAPQAWQKPRGKSMVDILLVGYGGNGGNGAVGANSTAAGGGGGGSGGQTRVTMPLHLLPDTLYVYLFNGGDATASSVTIYPSMVANHTIAYAAGGGNGGNASGATAGAAGTGPGAATAATMPLGWAFAQVLGGQAGIIGGVAVAGANLTIPTTGLFVTGGAGGGGLPAAAAAGTAGGSFTVAGVFPAHAGGAGPGAATSNPNRGAHGYRPIAGLLYGYGGAGGSSSHGSAIGGALAGGAGGDGAPGCGGGGGGGALTGSTQGLGGRGGSAFCVITCW